MFRPRVSHTQHLYTFFIRLIENLGLQGVPYSLAANCSVKETTNNSITLQLSKQHEGIVTNNMKKKLEKALQRYFESDLSLMIEIYSGEIETPAKKRERVIEKDQLRAEKNAKEDEVVKAFKSSFGAEVIEGSVKPIGD